jgi:hypothetical protein
MALAVGPTALAIKMMQEPEPLCHPGSGQIERLWVPDHGVGHEPAVARSKCPNTSQPRSGYRSGRIRHERSMLARQPDRPAGSSGPEQSGTESSCLLLRVRHTLPQLGV